MDVSMKHDLMLNFFWDLRCLSTYHTMYKHTYQWHLWSESNKQPQIQPNQSLPPLSSDALTSLCARHSAGWTAERGQSCPCAEDPRYWPEARRSRSSSPRPADPWYLPSGSWKQRSHTQAATITLCYHCFFCLELSVFGCLSSISAWLYLSVQ